MFFQDCNTHGVGDKLLDYGRDGQKRGGENYIMTNLIIYGVINKYCQMKECEIGETVAHMGEMKNACRILVGISEGRRPTGKTSAWVGWCYKNGS
jgi:hypothetical protein